MSCNHKFQGHKDGVTCLLCGLSMNPDEYREYLNPGDPETPEEPEKARKPRKKKEATTNE